MKEKPESSGQQAAGSTQQAKDSPPHPLTPHPPQQSPPSPVRKGPADPRGARTSAARPST